MSETSLLSNVREEHSDGDEGTVGAVGVGDGRTAGEPGLHTPDGAGASAVRRWFQQVPAAARGNRPRCELGVDRGVRRRAAGQEQVVATDGETLVVAGRLPARPR